MPLDIRFSVFTVITPEARAEETAALLKEIGFDGAEWRVTTPSPEDAPLNFWNGNRCTIDIGDPDAGRKRLRRLREEYGLEIPALGTYLLLDQVDQTREWMAVCADLGIPKLRVGVPHFTAGKQSYNALFDQAVHQYRQIETLAREHGVRALIEIHMGNICPSASAARRFCEHFDPACVGAILDPGNMIHEGYENWSLGVEVLGPWLGHVHAKNARWEVVEDEEEASRYRPTFAPLSKGHVWWPDVFTALQRVRYSGWMSLEDFAPTETRRKLTEDLAYLQALRDSV